MNQEKLGSFSENKGRAGKKQVLWAWLRTILLVLPHFFLSWVWFIPDFLYSRTSDSYLVKEMTLDIHNHDRKLHWITIWELSKQTFWNLPASHNTPAFKHGEWTQICVSENIINNSYTFKASTFSFCLNNFKNPVSSPLFVFL